MLTIERLTLSHLDLFVEHLARHLPEPGVGGIISQPYGVNESVDVEPLRKRTGARWSNTPGSGEWELTWGAFNDGKIIGHLDLSGIPMKAFQHRAKLGLGIEQPFRSQGLGKRLMEEALGWAKDQHFLAWIDLEVFAHNTSARKLYENFGFQLIGTTPDRIRVEGTKIDDCHYVLSLEALRNR